MNDEKPKDEFAAMTPDEIAKIEDAAIRSRDNMGMPEHVPGTIALDESELAAEVLEALEAGHVYEITQTDTITANIAELPVTTLSIDFMVEVLTPIHLAPRFMGVGLSRKELDGDPQAACRDLLKTELLREWHAHFDDSEKIHGEKTPEWVKGVTKVELIECDLLVPKVKKT